MKPATKKIILLGGAFSPLSLSPFAWYDPSDISTLFQNSNGTGAVTADSDPVGFMADKSGNGRHLTQSTAGSRPLYKTSGGLRWLEFDGVDDYLISGTFTTITSVDVLCAARTLAATNFQRLFEFGPEVTRADASDNSGSTAMRLETASATIQSAFTTGADFVLTARYATTGSRIAIDNGSYATGTLDAISCDTLVLAANASPGGNVGNVRHSQFIAFNRQLSDGEIAKLRRYLAAKQGRVL